MTEPEDMDLFGDLVAARTEKPLSDELVTKRVLITVKAAPNPSERHGETVCVAGIEIDDLGHAKWIRLYPINFRHLESDGKFKKYEVVTVDCAPARQDSRLESWKPAITTMAHVQWLRDWSKRKPWVESLITDDMCGLREAAAASPRNPSLGLVRAREILDFVVTPHPGWTAPEKAKIDAYVNQLELFDTEEKSALEAPAYRGHYKWLCGDRVCRGHDMGLIDWEFVALQRHLRGRADDEIREALRTRWLDEVCAPSKAVAFYVGNQAKRAQVFSVLGVWWPPR